MKKIINLILVIFWMLIIFVLSSMDSDESNFKSKEMVSLIFNKAINNNVEKKIATPTPDNAYKDEKNIESIPISEKKLEMETQKAVNEINKPFRKFMHITVYFVLAVLIMNLLYLYNIKSYRCVCITIIICFLYACSDEWHQTFVIQRNGQFIDCLIDSIGSMIGCLGYVLYDKILRKSDI